MRLQEFDLTPAVVFHDELNPMLWNGIRLDPDVRQKLLKIANDFREFIGIDLFDILDVTISGSNAAFTYTPNSDIDLHLVVMIPEAHDQELRQLFDAKKYQYNDQNDFKIHGFDVELYVQDATQPHHSMGIYSIKNDRWLKKPRAEKASVDDTSVKNKYRSYKSRIKQALKDNNPIRVKKLWDCIKDMRKAGLQTGGEFSPENLTFKLLRAEGDLSDLKDHMSRLKAQEFSLEEQQ
jgi:hypothetical protein